MHGYSSTTISKAKITSLALAMLVAIGGCNYKVQKQSSTPTGADESVFSPTATIDAKLVSESVLHSCRSCHAGQKPPDLSTMQLVKTHISKVVSEIESNAMPPSNAGYQALSNCQKAVLRQWWEAGMPEISDTRVSSLAACANGTGAPGEPPAAGPIADQPLTYDVFLKRVLQPKCLSCHNPEDRSEAAGILFYPYSELLRQKRRFKKPGATSKIIHAVTRNDEERMPPPPPESNIAPLTEDEVAWLIRWIDADIPEK
jgi:uncharacterized membrane protein